ncbi:MAG: hypothetical protein K8R90_10765, partial [Candidatus Cloacimonetes bacterium]|nr:hypothetical protein [Candidatus Cloacimonadota bacterium]
TARRIAKFLHLRHVVMTPEADPAFWDNLPEVVSNFNLSISAMVTAIPFFHLCHVDECIIRNSHELLSGVGGELYRHIIFKNTVYKPMTKPEFVQKLSCRFTSHVPPNVWKFDGTSQVKATVANWVEQQDDTDDFLHLSDRFFLQQYLSNATAVSVRYLGRHGRIFLPFVSRRLLMALQDYPTKDKLQGSLLQRFLCKHNPRLARFLVNDYMKIRCSGMSRPLADKRMHYTYYACRVINKLLGYQLFPAGYLSLDYDKICRQKYDGFVKRNFLTHPLLQPLIEKKNADEVLQGFMQGRNGNCLNFVSRAVTLNLFCESVQPNKK